MMRSPMPSSSHATVKRVSRPLTVSETYVNVRRTLSAAASPVPSVKTVDRLSPMAANMLLMLSAVRPRDAVRPADSASHHDLTRPPHRSTSSARRRTRSRSASVWTTASDALRAISPMPPPMAFEGAICAGSTSVSCPPMMLKLSKLAALSASCAAFAAVSEVVSASVCSVACSMPDAIDAPTVCP